MASCREFGSAEGPESGCQAILDGMSLSKIMMHHSERFRRLLLDSPLLPAPMCGYSDRPFRDLLRQMGAHLVYTEMFSAEAMIRGDPKTWRLMDFRNEPSPVVAQIFGNRPAAMAEAARIAVRIGADAVDLNMGCPAKKVVRSGTGEALPDDPDTVRAVVRAMRRAVDVPVTAKMRWRTDGSTLQIARICEDEGLDALALHARTRAQGYSGEARWSWIAALKQAVFVPVIGNGDVTTADDALRMRRETGCDAVMAGRALVGNPWLVRDVARALSGEEPLPPPDDGERLRVLLEHASLMYEHGGKRGLIEFRKHCCNYIKGLPGARQARPELMQATELSVLRELVEQHFGELMG